MFFEEELLQEQRQRLWHIEDANTADGISHGIQSAKDHHRQLKRSCGD